MWLLATVTGLVEGSSWGRTTAHTPKHATNEPRPRNTRWIARHRGLGELGILPIVQTGPLTVAPGHMPMRRLWRGSQWVIPTHPQSTMFRHLDAALFDCTRQRLNLSVIRWPVRSVYAERQTHGQIRFGPCASSNPLHERCLLGVCPSMRGCQPTAERLRASLRARAGRRPPKRALLPS